MDFFILREEPGSVARAGARHAAAQSSSFGEGEDGGAGEEGCLSIRSAAREIAAGIVRALRR